MEAGSAAGEGGTQGHPHDGDDALTVGLCLLPAYLRAFPLDEKLEMPASSRMSHQKIENTFQREKRPDFDLKILFF